MWRKSKPTSTSSGHPQVGFVYLCLFADLKSVEIKKFLLYCLKCNCIKQYINVSKWHQIKLVFLVTSIDSVFPCSPCQETGEEDGSSDTGGRWWRYGRSVGFLWGGSNRSRADPTGVGLMNLLYTGGSKRNVTVKVLMNDTHCDKVTMLFYYVTIKRFSLIIMIFHLGVFSPTSNTE